MYLVDAGYSYHTGFLPPYRGVRYHLSKYGPRNLPTNARELFNLRHSSLRVTIEEGIWGTQEQIQDPRQQDLPHLQNIGEDLCWPVAFCTIGS
jgi:hypothetical protein